MNLLRPICHGLLVVLFALGSLAASFASALSEGSMLVYIGSYTGSKSQGIYVSRFDPATGNLSRPELAAEAKNPSFLALHPRRGILYAVGEVDSFEGRPVGSVTAFRIDSKSGKLILLNQQPSGGAGPCHLAVDAAGKCLLVANYGSGSIAALPIQAGGALGQPHSIIQHQGSSLNPQRQDAPHAHFITPDPANRFALACDLGLDKVLVYRLDPNKAGLQSNDPPSISLRGGAGPRHLVFHPNGKVAYVINELDSTLTVFAYAAKNGALSELQTLSTLPDSFRGSNTGAEVQIHPSAKFVYASNRGHDSIAMFSVEPGTGKLTAAGHQSTQGKTPRHFALDPAGKWLLAENQDSDAISVFRVDSGTGKLTPTGSP